MDVVFVLFCGHLDAENVEPSEPIPKKSLSVSATRAKDIWSKTPLLSSTKYTVQAALSHSMSAQFRYSIPTTSILRVAAADRDQF
jgi:hypothetical protein